MDLRARRNLLVTVPNPGSGRDYVVVLRATVPAPGPAPELGGGPSVALRYVPDRRVLDPAAFTGYLAVLGRMAWPTLEALGTTLLDDVFDVTVARWLQVTVEAPPGTVPGAERHAVMLEDRQPRWNNPSLLSRLT